MAINAHKYLKNPVDSNNGFKKTRYVPPQDEEDEDPLSKIISRTHKDKLRIQMPFYIANAGPGAKERRYPFRETLNLYVLTSTTVFNRDLQKNFFNATA